MMTAMQLAMRTQYGCIATDGRTNVRRRSHAVASHLPAVDARGGSDRLATLAEVSAAFDLAPLGERHEVVRTGDRPPIPGYVRQAVWYRDHGRCEMCGDRSYPDEWELDHIVPWSAGGADTSDNLRVLCKRHNQERSNHRDRHERPRTRVTWWCLNCYSDSERHVWRYLNLGEIGTMAICPTHWPYGSPPPLNNAPLRRRCRVMGSYERFRHVTGEYPPNWHDRVPIAPDAAYTTAWCAHCGAPGLTDKPL